MEQDWTESYAEHFNESLRLGQVPLSLEMWAALHGDDIVVTSVTVPHIVSLVGLNQDGTYMLECQPYREPS